MKKRFVSLLSAVLALCLVLPLLATPALAEGTERLPELKEPLQPEIEKKEVPTVTVADVNRADGVCTFKANVEHGDEKGFVIAAVYDENGRLRKVETMPAGKKAAFKLEDVAETDVVKLMVTDRAGAPLVDAAEVTVQQVKEVRDFGAFLTRLLDDGRKNIAVSPLSAYIALSMAAEGAAGETLAQFEKVLGVSSDEFGAKVGGIIEHLMEVKGSTVLSSAQSAWTDESFTFEEEFLKKLEESYHADMFSGCLSSDEILNAINSWVSERTKGLIPKLLEDNLSDDAVLALINTLYFKGKWREQFDEKTSIGDFTTVSGDKQQAEYMHVRAHFRYLKLDDAYGVVLPYDDGKTAMVALMMTDRSASPSKLLAEHGFDELLKAVKDAKGRSIDLRFPKFETESTFELIEPLVRMGLVDAFDRWNADFSRMSEEEALYISRVLQKVKLIVDTEGTEAAAATAVIVEKATAIPAEPLYISFDRPFVYAVMDLETETPLFTGVFNTAK